MGKARWEEIEAIVKPYFDAGFQPDRNDLVELAYRENLSDDIIDAFDSLSGKPVPSLDELKRQLEENGVIE